MEIAAPASAIQRRSVAFPWLFSPPVDLGVMALPALLAAAGAAWASATGDGSGTGTRAYASWIAQFVLGNSTHVILTFLLLAARPDVLRATPRQARTVIVGSSLTFAVAFGLFALATVVAPAWSGFALAVGVVFSFHHTLSQAKGIWSLYNLRGKDFGVGPPSARERSLQRLFVPLGLLFASVRFFLVEKRPGIEIPFLPVMPGIDALLPFSVVYAMYAAWALFAALVLRELLRARDGEPLHGAKLFYVGCHLFGVALILVSPGWGGVFSASVHGLEYFALTRKMLEPRDASEGRRLAAIVPAILLTALPLVLVGVVNAPFTAALGVPASAAATWARLAMNGVVMAHYFADAFIYRFRIPEVRAVALRRLGFG